MFPLNIVLVGGNETVLAHVRKELFRASVTIEDECADLKEVIARLPVAAKRLRLFIVEVDSEEDVQNIRALGSRFPGHAILALMGAELEARTVINAMRAGAVQTVQLPWQAQDFQAALNQIGLQFGCAPGNKVVVVAGVHGGAGATLLSINLAYEIAFLYNIRCVLAELSLHIGVAAAYLNVTPKLCLDDLAGEDTRLDAYAVQELLLNITDRFAIIAGVRENAILPDPVFSAAQMLQIVDYCRHLAEVTVLDVPCTHDRFYFDILTGADEIVLLADQTLPSVRSLKMVMERLAKEGYAKSVFPVFNRFNPRKPGYAAEDLKALLRVPNVLTIADDPKLERIFEQGGSIRLRLPNSPVLGDLATLGAHLMGSTVEPAGKGRRSGWFDRFFHLVGVT